MSIPPLRLLVIGAHPDDADYHAGGLAALYRTAGHMVRLVSLTNGDAGHQTLRGTELATRRRAEAAAAGAVIGAEYQVLNHHDGELLPTLDNRREVIRLIRSFRPDLLLTHRPNDYHPDHRYTSQLVQDAAYMMTVPAIVPDTPHLPRNPVIAYMNDAFQKPCPFEPTALVDVGPVLDSIVSMLHCHASQFYEWLPYHGGYQHEVPTEDSARKAWLAESVRARLRTLRDRYAAQARAACGTAVEFIEAYEVCEYGSPLTPPERARLFPFVKDWDCKPA